MRARLLHLSRKSWFVPALILGLALGLRLWRLGDSNLWWDEALAIWGVRKGFVGVTLWTAGDVHPPLYFWSLWAWVTALGESEFAMRLLSVSFGVLTVAGVYALAHRVSGRRAAVWASLLTAIAPFHVWWSQEMRMYVLAGLLGVLSVYCLIRWLDDERVGARSDSRTLMWLVAYVAATIGAMYTIFLMGVVVLAENVAVVIALASHRYDRKRLFWRWVLAQVAMALLLGLWMVFSWDRMQSWSVSEPTTIRFVAELYATLLSSGVSVAIREVWWAWVPMLLVLVSGGALSLTRSSRKNIRWSHMAVVALSGLLPVALVYMATLPRSLFYTPRVEARYLLPFAPMVWIMMGWSLELVSKRWWRVGLVAGLISVGVSAAFLPRYYQGRVLDDELQSMVRCVLSQSEDGDVVLLDSGTRYPIFLYYYERLDYRGERPPVYLVPPNDEIVSEESISGIMPELVRDAKRVWLAEVDTNLSDPDRLARAWLEDRQLTISGESFGYNGLALFGLEPEIPEIDLVAYSPQYSLDSAPLGGGLLAGWEMPVDVFEPGSDLHITLLWEQMPAEEISVEVLSMNGDLIARRTLGPGSRQQFDWTVGSSWPNGVLQVVAVAGESVVQLGELRVVHSSQPVERLEELSAAECFGEVACLQGFALTDSSGRAISSASAGDELVLDLRWLAGDPDQDYVVFAHLLGEAYNPATSGPVWGQSDTAPAGGAARTVVWQSGETVFDRHVLELDQNAPDGVYRCEVGLYAASDGARVLIPSADGEENHLVLPVEIIVR